MANLKEQSSRDRSKSVPRSGGGGIRGGIIGFLLGILLTILSGVGLGVWYFLFLRPQGFEISVRPAITNSSQPASQETTPPENKEPSTETTSETASETSESANPSPSQNQAGQTTREVTQSLNTRLRHPNGTVLEVTGMTLGADNSIKVSMITTNGSNRHIKLNSAGGDTSGLTLKDNLGNTYPFITPKENVAISVAPGATLKGELAFRGPVESAATSLTLTTNERSGNEKGETTHVPKFVVNIPIQR
jgi:cytoskeletal protein RodZ